MHKDVHTLPVCCPVSLRRNWHIWAFLHEQLSSHFDHIYWTFICLHTCRGLGCWVCCGIAVPRWLKLALMYWCICNKIIYNMYHNFLYLAFGWCFRLLLEGLDRIRITSLDLQNVQITNVQVPDYWSTLIHEFYFSILSYYKSYGMVKMIYFVCILCTKFV